MTNNWPRNFVQNLAYATALAAAAISGSALALASSTQAYAQAAPAAQSVKLSSKAMVERIEKAADGSDLAVLKTPDDVIIVPGDTIVFTISYVNSSAEPATGFRATNPMPGAIRFVEAAEDWAVVSADGGKTFGKLGELTITERIEEPAVYDDDTGAKISDARSQDVTRNATHADVTHVRWNFADAIAPGNSGSVSYRGVVK